MKTIVKPLLLSAVVIAFSAFLPADECAMYVPVKEGSEMEYKNYSDKDKLSGTNKTKVISVKKTATGQEVEMKTESFDKKDKPVGTSNYIVTCDNGSFSIDMRTMITQEQMESFKDAKVTIEADKLDIPANPQAGQALENGTVKMTTVSESAPIAMKLTINVSNRQVAGIEDVTVPAGTFKCVKITYDVESKFLFTVRSKGIDWYAKEVGLVKSESYSTKDKLQGYTVLNSKK
jgi:hypothetical protein